MGGWRWLTNYQFEQLTAMQLGVERLGFEPISCNAVYNWQFAVTNDQ